MHVLKQVHHHFFYHAFRPPRFLASVHFTAIYHFSAPAANPFLAVFLHYQFFHIMFAMAGDPMAFG
jgi:hypothetical protein